MPEYKILHLMPECQGGLEPYNIKEVTDAKTSSTAMRPIFENSYLVRCERVQASDVCMNDVKVTQTQANPARCTC